MRRVVLTFLLTSLFWWALFTYYAYERGVRTSSSVNELIEEDVKEFESSDNSVVVTEAPITERQKPASSSKRAVTQKQSAVSPPNTAPKSADTNNESQTSADKAPVIQENTPEPVVANAQANVDYKQEIVGKWNPVEGAKEPLEFTKYGTVIHTVYNELHMRYDYRITSDKIKIRYDDATFKIIKEGNTTYLEIYNSEDFSGRYRRISQPTKINASVIDKSAYPTHIIGKWTPITGQENPIEFTKFNTAIQMVYDMLDMRYEYSLNEDRLSIRHDKNARVVISEDANNYYLEIFNTTDFSGRYKKSK